MENKIISAAVYDRAAFDQLESCRIHADLSDQGQVIWKLLRTFYNKDSSSASIDKELLKQSISREVPKHAELFNTLIDSYEKPSIPNLLHEIIEQKKDRNSRELTQALSLNKETQVAQLWNERETLLTGDLMSDEDNQIIIAPDLTSIFEARKAENRISVVPKVLNDHLEGGLLNKHHVVIYGVTDLGKTLFTLDWARHFIECGRKVLYVLNEDPLSDLIERFLTNLLQKDKWQIRKHYDKAQVLAEKKHWENLIWAELTPGTFPEIESLIKEHKPDVLMVDQIRNIETGDKDGVARLESAAQSMRNIGKRHNILSISITQAGDSADGKAILGRGDIHGSNVGIPGTTDLMLGIGATMQMEIDGIRTLSFAKNKVSGGKAPIQVFFNTKTMRIE